ncbi:stretch-activated Ca2+-permeable channel component-domain-containing protein [Trichophaea hybrida]|nr:stretch-activated Ca2+-permeable channel component-domain-containing protein [Trichophaea hybrida]
MAIATEPIPPLWRRRRKPRFDFIALLFYTLTVVLVPPWAAVLAGLRKWRRGPRFYTEKVSLEGFGFDIADEATLDRRSSFTREEQNGVVRPQNIEWGIVGRKREEEAEEWVEKRQQKSKMVHITFNTCLQPIANGTAEDGQLRPPQLEVFVSNSTYNKSPGPTVQGKVQYVMPIDGGFGSLDITVTGDIWVGVYAVRLPSSVYKDLWSEKSPWNYELALSTDEPYHGFQENQFLYLVDTDDSSALLVTGNMTDHSSLDGGTDESTKDLMNPSYTPYAMYAQNRNITSRFNGLEKSYCAVRQLAQIRPANTDVSMTTRGLGNLPKQQFHLKELNRSSEYWSYLARPRNNSASDTSGILWMPLQLNTKKDGNCQIIYNLSFCSEVAYAVPSNPTIFGDLNNLTTFYDNNAQNWWQNFTYSLQQVQCNASSSAQYSPIRNCDDCAAAYKNWLCAVTIPRCMDYSSDLSYLAARSSNKLFWNATAQGWQKHPWMPTLSQDEVNNWTNSSGWLVNGNQSMSSAPNRNAQIDDIVKPGPTKRFGPAKTFAGHWYRTVPLCWGFYVRGMGPGGRK